MSNRLSRNILNSIHGKLSAAFIQMSYQLESDRRNMAKSKKFQGVSFLHVSLMES